MGSITLNKPSGGQLTLSPEDGATNETVTIPAGGVMPADAPTGKILQVQSVETNALLSTTSTAWQDIVSVSITPTSATSKIFITITSVMGAAAAISSAQSVFRDSTQILAGQGVAGVTPSSGPSVYGGSADGNNNEAVAIQGMDTPNTTSQVTYYFKYRSPQGGVVRVNDLGSGSRSQTYSQTSSTNITVMEVAQ